MRDKKVKVLMVTGVYFPEVNGAILQCMRVISILKNQALFNVLTSTNDIKKVEKNKVGGITVERVFLNHSKIQNIIHIIKTSIFLVRNRNQFDIVHLHGFSLRSIVTIFWSKILNKKIIIKMTSVGHDDPDFIFKRGKLLYYFYLMADAYIGISPAFYNIYSNAGLANGKYHNIPNGVDAIEFTPVKNDKEKNEIREKLNLPKDIKLIIFVGHFSYRKSPDHLLEAWLKYIESSDINTGIVFIGRTNQDRFEIDNEVVDFIKSSTEKYIDKTIFFREDIYPIDEYYKACDVYVLSSSSEGLPNSLLEAMSCALPIVSTRIKGITDWIIKHNYNGLMYEYGDIDELHSLLENILDDSNLRENLGLNARKTVREEFAISNTANKINKLYRSLLNL